MLMIKNTCYFQKRLRMEIALEYPVQTQVKVMNICHLEMIH